MPEQTIQRFTLFTLRDSDGFAVDRNLLADQEGDYVRYPDLLAALAEKDAEIPKWQPIATAPKDGTHVLVWWEYWSRHPTVAWVDRFGRWVSEIALDENGDHPPTYWQPLPSPPTEKGS